MSDPTDPLSWVVRAEEDYAVARSALRRKPAFTYTACFHAQQSAEKYLKALLVAGGHPFSKVHDLLILNDECVRSGIFVDVSEDQLSRLSHYAVRVRYLAMTRRQMRRGGPSRSQNRCAGSSENG